MGLKMAGHFPKTVKTPGTLAQLPVWAAHRQNVSTRWYYLTLNRVKGGWGDLTHETQKL